MRNYSIPSIYIPGFESIIKLNDEEINYFAKVISELKIGELEENIYDKIKSGLNSHTAIEITGMVQSIVSLVDIFETANRDIDQFTSDFSQSYLFVNRDATEDDRLLLKKHLSVLLKDYNSIRITSKARDIIFANSNNFREAKVISDIRLIFEDDLATNRKIAVVVHNLKFEYFSENENKEFFISLDLSDLKKMKATIDRALDKDRIIRENNHVLDFIDIL